MTGREPATEERRAGSCQETPEIRLYFSKGARDGFD